MDFILNLDVRVYFLLLGIIAILVILKLFLEFDKWIQSILHKIKPEHRRAVKRVYTEKQKTRANIQCGYRCEGTHILLRCRYRGRDLQGDHWYPYARGGATSIQNLVMLCPTCNGRKTSKIPTRLQTMALQRRRKGKGYSDDAILKIGEWLPRDYVNGEVLENNARIDLTAKPTF